MDPVDVTPKEKPESKIQAEIIEMLETKGWYVKETHGNMYQSGFPDLFATHHLLGHRWIEVKKPNRQGAGCFTNAQLDDFPKFCSAGSGVWVLVAATAKEYKKLLDKYNWWKYLGVAP